MTLRFAIVGCGAISLQMHVPTLMSCEGAVLTTAIDSDLDQARAVAARFGIPNASAKLSDWAGELDAVLIATPPGVRPHLIAEAFTLGLDVLAEKPLANTLEECEQLSALALSSGRILGVAHMYRFYPVRVRMLELVATHELGRIQSVCMHEGDAYSWQSRSGYTVKRGEVSGGVLANAGIHSLDSLIQWFGDPIIESYEDDSLGGLESNARTMLRFASGVQADFRISRTCRLPSSFRIHCEHGVLSFSNRAIVDYQIERAGSTNSFRLDDVAATAAECWRAQLRDFIDVANARSRPRVDGIEGSRVVSLIEEMYSLKRSRTLPAVAPQPGLTW